jgi:RNA polymerase sigma-70 factor (ECF subfamily)
MSIFDQAKERIALAKIRLGQEEAFSDFYDLYVEQIYRFIYFKVSSVEEAEDLTSESFMRLWQYILNNQEVSNIKALLYRIARNLVIDFYRDKGRGLEIELADNTEDESPDTPISDNLADVIDIKITMEVVQGALGKIKDNYREVVVMHYVEQLDISEIAEILEKTEGNVRVLLHRGITELKKVLSAK